ncbi:unnamed protein product [Rhodiola kirilowii]
MASFSVETVSVEQKQQESVERPDRSHWVLDSPEPPGLLQDLISSLKKTIFPQRSSTSKTPSRRALSFLEGVFPILRWGRTYKANMFKNDLLAGLTLASICIPQSIGYANLAKLDPQYGLYTSVVPPLIYALMGSSRDLAIGPVAVVSMLMSSMVQQIADPVSDPITYRKIIFTSTFFAGTFQAAFGLFRLGFLVDFLSHAVIVGFMAGAAIIIGLQQLKGLFGMSHFTTKTDIISVFKAVFTSLHHPWYPLNVVLGASFLIFILLTRFIGKRRKKLFWLPAIAPLISVILSTLIVYLAKADKHGVKIVKNIKGGLNPISASQLQFSGSHVAQAAKIGLISAVIALTEAMAVGRSFASIKGYHLDGNKEMLAIGCMNVVGSVTSCYVATGSFSRTAVNFSAGCKTAISNIVMAITVLISLELLTRFLYYTPIAILASIILSALPGLIDLHEAYCIWKVDKLDFLACISAFFGVLFGSVEIGLMAAVMVSLAKIVLVSMRPGAEVVGKIPGTDIFCDISQYPMAAKTPGILIIRVNSALFCFANANFIREKILRRVSEEDSENATKGGLHFAVLDMSNVMNIDTSGIIALEDLHKKLGTTGIKLGLANPRWEVTDKLKKAKFVDKIGRKWLFMTVREAVESCSESENVNGHGEC